MPYDNSEFLFVIWSTKRLIGRMKEVYRFRERRAARLKIEICSLLGNRLPKDKKNYLPERAPETNFSAPFLTKYPANGLTVPFTNSRRGEFVFANPITGRAITDCKKAFTKASELAGIEDLHSHDTRHTAATRMADTGAEPSTIKDILGHSDLRMTDRYTHAVESRKRTALERIAGFGKNAEVINFQERREARN